VNVKNLLYIYCIFSVRACNFVFCEEELATLCYNVHYVCRHACNFLSLSLKVKCLSRSGGTSVKECVRWMIKVLLMNELQERFNRTGTNGKIAFNQKLEPLIKGTLFLTDLFLISYQFDCDLKMIEFYQ
jgi:hypothetical protein